MNVSRTHQYSGEGLVEMIPIPSRGASQAAVLTPHPSLDVEGQRLADGGRVWELPARSAEEPRHQLGYEGCETCAGWGRVNGQICQPCLDRYLSHPSRMVALQRLDQARLAAFGRVQRLAAERLRELGKPDGDLLPPSEYEALWRTVSADYERVRMRILGRARRRGLFPH